VVSANSSQDSYITGWLHIVKQVEDLIESAALAAALDAKPETQRARIAEIVAKAAVGERARP